MQETFGLPKDEDKQLLAKAKLLPDPLYLLYSSVYAYSQDHGKFLYINILKKYKCDICINLCIILDKLINLSINGDDADARQYIKEHKLCESDSETEIVYDNAEVCAHQLI